MCKSPERTEIRFGDFSCGAVTPRMWYCCSEEGGDCFDRNLLGEKEQGVDLSVGSECEEVGYHRLVGRKRFSGRHAIAGRTISPFEIAERLPECRIVMIGSGGL